MVNKLPPVGRIQGAVHVMADPLESSHVQIQYTDDQDAWHEMSVPFLDAMYLLNLLKASQLDAG